MKHVDKNSEHAAVLGSKLLRSSGCGLTLETGWQPLIDTEWELADGTEVHRGSTRDLWREGECDYPLVTIS